jgi:hypothetical protein
MDDPNFCPECRLVALAIMQEFLLDHLRDHTLDQYTFELLMDNLEDYL